MKNRKSIRPWPALPDQKDSLAETSLTMSLDPVGEGPDPVRLCETWRAWEAGTSSQFLNWFLFTRHETTSPAPTAVLEDWICFNHGSSELDGRARAVLGDRLGLFRAKPSMRIVIGGLAGRPGPIDHVMSLGLGRVQSIRSFLLVHGIDRGRIGILIRGSGWSVAERSGGPGDSMNPGGECRLQVTDPHWTLARN